MTHSQIVIHDPKTRKISAAPFRFFVSGGSGWFDGMCVENVATQPSDIAKIHMRDPALYAGVQFGKGDDTARAIAFSEFLFDLNSNNLLRAFT